MELSRLQSLATQFESELIKVAYIRKLPNGKWVVKSRKGKTLGTYDTKELAVKRLRQIEFWKHKKASDDSSYSSVMRELNKDGDTEAMKRFQDTYKQVFDDEYLSGSNNPEEKAFEEAMKSIALVDDRMIKKVADLLPLGDAQYTGKYLAHLLKFLLRRISSERRPRSIENLKRKVFYLNEYNIAGKRTPPSSAIGQSITLLKHLLIGHNPVYIRSVLNTIVSHL